MDGNAHSYAKHPALSESLVLLVGLSFCNTVDVQDIILTYHPKVDSVQVQPLNK